VAELLREPARFMATYRICFVKAQWGPGRCLLALKSGMRKNEKASLSWADVDMVNSLIRVRAENCSVRGGDVLVFSTGSDSSTPPLLRDWR
jgi:hypothetical protein